MSTPRCIYTYNILAFAVSLLVLKKPVMWDFLYSIHEHYRQGKVAVAGTANMLSKFAPFQNSTLFGERLP